MPTPIDNSIALQAQTPNPMNTIGGIMNFAKGAQELQAGRQNIERGGIALKQESMDLQERNALRELSGKLGQFSTESGEPDYARLIDAATAAAPKQGMAWVQNLAKTHVESIAAKSAINKLSDEQRASVGQVVMSVADRPLEEQEKALDNLVKGNPGLKTWGDLALQRLKDAGDNRKQVALKIGQATMGTAQQATAMQPSGPMFNTGQVSGQINTNPLAIGGGQIGPVAGTMTQNQLPPSTQVFDAGTNTFKYLGPQSSPGNPQAQPALGVPENVRGNVEVVNKDWGDTVANAKTAAQDVGVLQEIKKYAPGALTGVASDRRAFIAGLAGLVGMSEEQLQKTDTDLLAKNSHMLALAGGDTNLAKTLAESANPNTKMTPEAIHKAADQVIAQRQLSLARQQYLGQFKNDPEKYTKAMNDFNQAGDPRVIQLLSMSPEERKQMKAAMSPKERKDFGDKIDKLHELGIIK